MPVSVLAFSLPRAEQAPGYEALTAAIKAGSRLAIWLSTRI